jgi:hypothetical protein
VRLSRRLITCAACSPWNRDSMLLLDKASWSTRTGTPRDPIFLFVDAGKLAGSDRKEI